ncbi:MAG TPA: hemerythrin domain-containing protein [Terracidiphilus sp.]|nr:hemerythrin domain-containing protein [Terracidiphilus sp.]
MGIQIGAKPDSGFDDPLGMLQDCHRRIERFLRILCVVAERATGRRMTDEESSAVTAALLYFREGGRRHNADEEESLFPRLRAAEASERADDLAHLEADHRHTGLLHGEIEVLYDKWMEDGVLSSTDQQKLHSGTRELEGIYSEHIKLEESTVFPQAAQVLDKATIAAMGREFKDRRH